VSGGDSPQRATWVAQRDARTAPLLPHPRARTERQKRARELEQSSE
jgi:hypothetical protein